MESERLSLAHQTDDDDLASASGVFNQITPEGYRKKRSKNSRFSKSLHRSPSVTLPPKNHSFQRPITQSKRTAKQHEPPPDLLTADCRERNKNLPRRRSGIQFKTKRPQPLGFCSCDMPKCRNKAIKSGKSSDLAYHANSTGEHDQTISPRGPKDTTPSRKDRFVINPKSHHLSSPLFAARHLSSGGWNQRNTDNQLQ